MPSPTARQGDLFAAGHEPLGPGAPEPDLPLSRDQLLAWQDRLAAHQEPLFADAAASDQQQGLLFSPASAAAPAGTPVDAVDQAAALQPLALRSQPLSFWRWPQPNHQGAALYFVTDRPSRLPQPLLLYIGETGRADRRWKGDHDCKDYLAHYSEALRRQGLELQLSIRFWLDVPESIKARRQLEQALIRRWLPPFNKETRQRWPAPFTALLDPR